MKILVRDEHGVRDLEEGYASEEELQAFLRDNAELLPLEEIDFGTSPLLCIGYEVNVASGWQDLLYIDETGLLTVVETKLRRNPEARREVVGQILEYAADTCLWSADDIETRAQAFLSSDKCPGEYRGKTLEQALLHFLNETNPSAHDAFSYSEFLNAARSKLEEGHIRLVIAIDEPPPALLRTVEFINRNSEHFEMYLFQLKRFHDERQEIFVPALFGRVGIARGGRSNGIQWDREKFVERATRECPERVPILQRLIDDAAEAGDIVWGNGAKIGSFTCALRKPTGGRLSVYFVTTTGKMSFSFSLLSRMLDERTVASYRDALRRAKSIPSTSIEAATWKEFDVKALESEEDWKAFRDATSRLRQLLSASASG